jgi:hypothetical protein
MCLVLPECLHGMLNTILVFSCLHESEIYPTNIEREIALQCALCMCHKMLAFDLRRMRTHIFTALFLDGII